MKYQRTGFMFFSVFGIAGSARYGSFSRYFYSFDNRRTDCRVPTDTNGTAVCHHTTGTHRFATPQYGQTDSCPHLVPHHERSRQYAYFTQNVKAQPPAYRSASVFCVTLKHETCAVGRSKRGKGSAQIRFTDYEETECDGNEPP